MKWPTDVGGPAAPSMIMFSVVTAVLGATFAAEALTARRADQAAVRVALDGLARREGPACPLTRQRPAASVAWKPSPERPARPR